MYKAVLFFIGSLLFVIEQAAAQTYTPIPVTGFTQDAFAESGTNAVVQTTTSLDATNHIMYTTDFATANGLAGGVLNTGTFTSGNRTYQLAPYTGNNALYLSLNGAVASTTATSTLSVQTPASFSNISFLSFSTEGSSTLNVVLTFADGTVYNAGNFVFADWFGGSNAIYSSFGRIGRIAAAPYVVDGLPTNPRWYAADIPISCGNQQRLLKSITISYIAQSGTSGRAVALAVSGVAFSPVTSSGIVTAATCGASNGSIALSATGGTAPLSVVWNTTPPQFSYTATGLAGGQYIATITDANGCQKKDTFIVNQSGAINAVATANPASICLGDTTTITATPNSNNYTYTWMPGNLTGQSIRVFPADTTTYTVTISDGNGCSSTGSVTVQVKKKPIAAFTTSPLRFCLGNTDTVRFTGTAGSTAVYNWNFGNATIVNGSGAGPYTLLFPTAGSKTITLGVTENGCSSPVVSQMVTVDAKSQPAFTAAPATICNGDTVTVTFTGTAVAGATPTWNWGGGTVISGSGLGPYRVAYNSTGTLQLVISNNTCTDTAATKTVAVTPFPVTAFTSSVLQGCTPLTVSFTNHTPTATSYLWQFGDHNSTDTSRNPQYVYRNPGSYQVRLTAINGNCAVTSATQTIVVSDPPVAAFTSTPAAAATPLQLSQALFNFTNTSTGASTYAWYFGDRDSSHFTNPQHRYIKAGLFTVTLYAYNPFGCMDSISVAPYIIIADSALRIPNAFSPNNDGTNDRWQIPGLLGYPDCTVAIFDRYGLSIYQSTGYNNPWDGKRNGKDMPVGTYYYIIRAGIQAYTGWVFLVR